jgi:transposase
MARYKLIDMSPRLLPVVLEVQLVPGSFAHAVHHLVDQLDLSLFDAYYQNDKPGSSAQVPSVLPKPILLAYSQSRISSRGIERACRDRQ